MITFILLIIFGTHFLLAQPMSGNYTIGGTNNDFATLMEAKYALTARGVSGPVFFDIRPGIYMEDNGNKTVLRLDSLINGLSETSRITFQPDASSGGNADNVILQRNVALHGDQHVVVVQVDYITIRNLTIRDNDTSNVHFKAIVFLQNQQFNITVDEFVIENCKLIGTSHSQANVPHTTFGINGGGVGNIKIRNNTFIRFYGAIWFQNPKIQGPALIEDNIILESWGGSFEGHSIGIDTDSLIIKGNRIDNSNSFSGISAIGINVVRARYALIEGNQVFGLFSTAIGVNDGARPDVDSVIVVNNMLRSSLLCQSKKTKIIFNTIVITQNGPNTALYVQRPDCEVFNNTLIDLGTIGFRVTYDQGNQQSPNLLSDYNIIYKDLNATGPLVIRNAVQYLTLSEYQAATGLDSNSIRKLIEFEDILSDLHLTECQAQDPDLKGIPIAGIMYDIDGDLRDTKNPTMGADEAVINNNPFFGKTFTGNLPGTPFSITAGKFDNIIGDGIAVPDYDNRKVYLYHNNASTNSFSLSGTLSTEFKPISVVFHDFDDDGNLDLIVSGQNPDGIKVFWGDGIGNFPQMSEVEGPLALNMLPEPHKVFEDFQTIFVPNGQFFGYLFHTGSREICFDYQHSDQWGTIDTLPNFINGAVIGNFGGDEMVEVAGVSNSTGHFALIHNIHQLELGLGNCFAFSMMAGYTEHNFSTGWYSYANSIIQGDFDNDGDIDFITTGFSSSNVIFIRNEGSFNFTHEIIQTDDLARSLAVLDYDNDGDLDFVALNLSDVNGVTLFVNDGSGNFSARLNCFQNLIEGMPSGVVAKDFDLDGLTDIAVSTLSNQFFVLYNLGVSTSVRPENQDVIPSHFSLSQNYPNPFNPSTRIEYTLPAESNVKISVFNILGEKVKDLVNEQKTSGTHTINFNAGNLASGIYFYRIEAKALSGVENFNTVKKMLLLK